MADPLSTWRRALAAWEVTMQIGYLGTRLRRGTEGAVVVADPWSRATRFRSRGCSSRRTSPGAARARKLEDPRKPRFVYVSHEHADHFDREFLASLARRDFTAVCRASGGPSWP